MTYDIMTYDVMTYFCLYSVSSGDADVCRHVIVFSQSVSLTQYVVLCACLSACPVPVRLFRSLVNCTNVYLL